VETPTGRDWVGAIRESKRGEKGNRTPVNRCRDRNHPRERQDSGGSKKRGQPSKRKEDKPHPKGEEKAIMLPKKSPTNKR